MDLVLVVILK